jgi:hypothetical protein
MRQEARTPAVVANAAAPSSRRRCGEKSGMATGSVGVSVGMGVLLRHEGQR